MINLTVILDSIAYPEGCFVATDWTPTGMTVPMAVQRYYITDHLGSTRVVLSNTGSILEDYDYSPYGEKVPATVANTGNTDYLYTGKESQQSASSPALTPSREASSSHASLGAC